MIHAPQEPFCDPKYTEIERLELVRAVWSNETG
jgi:hypothetical protein